MAARSLVTVLLLVCAVVAANPSAGATRKPLQVLIDATDNNATLRLEPGVYAGPVVIDHPMTLDGGGQATIDAGGHGTVVLLDTDGAVLRNLHLTNSGSSHNDIDAGVQVRGRFNVIKDNTIDNCLFGVDLQQSEYNVVRRNRIRSKPFDLGLRGDSVRLWYSFDNKITDNTMEHVRDLVVWYSKNNLIAGNHTYDGRYGLHFMYSQENDVENNTFLNNSVGIFLMYSDGVKVVGNRIERAVGASGMGIGFKESSDITIQDNQILYCATALYLDLSPYQPGTSNRIRGNTVAYSSVGVRLHNDWTGNVFEHNRFKDNITQVAVDGGATAKRNRWYANQWDDYRGFDRNHDGVGDTPYTLYAYADRLWMDVPSTQFFKGAPVLETLDFLERLAPFTPPVLLLEDQHPLLVTENP